LRPCRLGGDDVRWGMASVFLNNEFVERDSALVSAFDAGLQHGVGLFETMLAVRSPGAVGSGVPGAFGIVSVHAHMQRLALSARVLGLSESLRVNALAEACARTVDKAALEMPSVDRFRVRLTVTGGDLNMLGRPIKSAGERGEDEEEGDRRSGQDPTVLIVAQPATLYPDEMFERGVAAVIADLKVNPLDPFSGHKTLNYWGRLRELQVAAGKRAGEALVFQVTNHLAGGCVSNAFVVKDGVLYTPIARGEEQEVAGRDEFDHDDEDEGGPGPGMSGAGVPGGLSGGTTGGGNRRAVMPSPVLPGVTRRTVMDLAGDRGTDVVRRMLTIDDVLNADEVFLTNSSWGVLPVVKVEREAIGDGVVGPMTKALRGAWEASVIER